MVSNMLFIVDNASKIFYTFFSLCLTKALFFFEKSAIGILADIHFAIDRKARAPLESSPVNRVRTDLSDAKEKRHP